MTCRILSRYCGVSLLLLVLAAAACSSPDPISISSQPVPGAPPWLAGQVVDIDDHPVAGTPVRIYAGLATRSQIGVARTDTQGRFAFPQRAAAATQVGNPATDYVGVCAGETVANFNPPSYLPWTDVQIAPGGGATCRLVLDEATVARRLAQLRAR